MFRNQFYALVPELQFVVEPFQAFTTIVREQLAEAFEDWMQAGGQKRLRCSQTIRTRSSARPDQAAFRTALSLARSNGQAEGQINRLKLIKRQMYVRTCRIDLLRVRVP